MAVKSNLVPLGDVIGGFSRLARLFAVEKRRKPRAMQLRDVILC